MESFTFKEEMLSLSIALQPIEVKVGNVLTHLSINNSRSLDRDHVGNHVVKANMVHDVFLAKPIYQADNNPKPPPKSNGTKGPKGSTEPQGPPQPIDGGYGKKGGSSAKRNCTALHRLGAGSRVNATFVESFHEVSGMKDATAMKYRVSYGYSNDGFVRVPGLPNPGACVDY